MTRYVALLVLVLVTVAAADEIILNNGNGFHGRIVREDESTVTLRLSYGLITFRRDDIREIRRDEDEENLESELEAHLRRGNFVSARAVAEALVQSLRQDERPERLAGWLVYISGAEVTAWQIESAARSLERAKELAPNMLELAEAQRRLVDAEGEILDRLKLAERALDRQQPRFDPLRAEALLGPVLDTDVPVAGKIRRTYATALTLQAASMLRTRVDRAVELMQEAIEITPEASEAVKSTYVIARVLAAQEDHAAKRPGAALAHVQMALEVDAESGPARYVRGQLFQASDQLERAARDYLFVLDEPPPPGKITRYVCDELRRRCAEKIKFVVTIKDLVPVVAGKTYADDLKLLTATEDDIIAHAPDRRLLRLIFDLVEAHRARVEKLLGFDDTIATFDKPLEIFLHPTKQSYMKTTDNHDHFSGMTVLGSDRAGRLTVHEVHSWAGADNLADTVLPHELAHVLVSAHLGYGVDLPRWLSEGVAIQAESNASTVSRKLVIRRKVRNKEHLDLRQMMLSKRYPSTAEESSIYYAQSYSLVLYLRDKFKDKDFWEFARTSEGDLEGAYREAFGEELDTDTLEEQWKIWVQK